MQIDGLGGLLAFNAILDPGAVGWHYLTFTRTNNVNPTTIECIDVESPGHYITLPSDSYFGITNYGRNTLHDARDLIPLKSRDIVSDVTCRKFTGGNTVTSADVICVPGLVTGINTTGKPIQVNVSIAACTATATPPAQAIVAYLYIDGNAVNITSTMQVWSTQLEFHNMSCSVVVPVEAGHHCIAVGIFDAGGTGLGISNGSISAHEIQ
jgi:hypothetical protein